MPLLADVLLLLLPDRRLGFFCRSILGGTFGRLAGGPSVPFRGGEILFGGCDCERLPLELVPFWSVSDPLLLVFGVLLGTFPLAVKPVLPGGGGRDISSADSAGGLAYMSMVLDFGVRTEVAKPYLLSLP